MNHLRKAQKAVKEESEFLGKPWEEWECLSVNRQRWYVVVADVRCAILNVHEN